MKRFAGLTMAACLAAAGLAAAGEGHKCTATAQECLDKMSAKLATQGWLGVYMEVDEPTGKKVVTEVVADSPAAAAGFRAGDVFVAVNGLTYDKENHEALKKLHEAMIPGAKITYTVARGSHNVDLAATLARMPDAVRERWIGAHMQEHAAVHSAAK